MNERVWSAYSDALADAYRNTTDNLIVQACPGSGKTTNIMRLWDMIDCRRLYLVFNKQNQIEAESKLTINPGSMVKTLNGFGASVIFQARGRVTLDRNKIKNIIREDIAFGKYDKKKFEKTNAIAKAISIAKFAFVHANDMGYVAFHDLCDQYDIDTYSGMYADALGVLKHSDAMQDVIDFDDQIRFPVVHNLAMPQFDVVFGDEWQDANALQNALVKKLNTRVVLVGDKRQSIYGFRGALSNSMDYAKALFNCTELPLKLTYRCAKTIAERAYEVWPDIEALENADEGLIRHSSLDKEVITKDDMVLCRNNAPIIALAYDFLSHGIACHVRGRDIGEGLIRLIKKFNVESIPALKEALGTWLDNEIANAHIKEDMHKAERAKDKYESIMSIAGDMSANDSIDMLIDKINSVFEEGKGICLATVHRSKGLEANRVYLYKPELMPSKAAKLAWQQEQEQNVLYVAITRARKELVYI